MGQKIIELTCPGCGARISTNLQLCEWCHQPIIITSFESVIGLSILEAKKYANIYRKGLEEDPEDNILIISIAMCYLKLKMYDKALNSFEKALENSFDNSEIYFLAAVCILKGKKANLAHREDINKIEEYINAANEIEPKGIYYYFWGYIKLDYYERKCLNTSPTYYECFLNAEELGTTEYDKNLLFELLGIKRPNGF